MVQVWGPPLLRYRHAEVWPHELQPLRLWMRERDDAITVGVRRGHDSLLHETQGARAAAMVCQLAQRLCQGKYERLQLIMRLAHRRVGTGCVEMVEVDEVLSGLGAMSVGTLCKLGASDEVRPPRRRGPAA